MINERLKGTSYALGGFRLLFEIIRCEENFSNSVQEDRECSSSMKNLLRMSEWERTWKARDRGKGGEGS